MDLGALALGPRLQDGGQRRHHVQIFGVEAPEVLVGEDQPHARVLVDPQHVGGAEAQVVVFEHEAPAHRFGQRRPGLDPAPVARGPVAVGAPDMDHHHGLGAKLHQIEHLGLGG